MFTRLPPRLRSQRTEDLQQLLSDTRENERRLDAAITVDSAAAVDIGRLAGALFGRAPLPPVDTLVAWFRARTFSSSDFQPLSGTYGALLATGDVRLIQTDSLRALLVATLEHEETMLRLFLEQSAGAPDRLAAPMQLVASIAHSRPKWAETNAR